MMPHRAQKFVEHHSEYVIYNVKCLLEGSNVRLFRVGPKGSEKPATVDADGNWRDLSGVVADISPDQLGAEALATLNSIDPLECPVLDAEPRVGVPISGIGKFIGIGLNYSDHAAEVGKGPPSEPIIFTKAISSITGPNDDVVIPEGSAQSDWEVELAIVIGKRAKNVPLNKALDYVAGYMICNDVSEREYQLERGGSWDKGKGCDTFGPLGPEMVTFDEVADPHSLDLWLDADGERIQTSNTRTLIVKVNEVLSYVWRFITLEPGDVIATSTPPGVGMGKSPQRFLKPGDVMTLGVECLGVQRRTVIAA